MDLQCFRKDSGVERSRLTLEESSLKAKTEESAANYRSGFPEPSQYLIIPKIPPRSPASITKSVKKFRYVSAPWLGEIKLVPDYKIFT